MSKRKRLAEENKKLKALLATMIKEPTPTFSNSRAIAESKLLTFAGMEIEEFHVMIMDNKHREIKSVMISRGTINQSLVHPREVFYPAVHARAGSIVLLHNHPSGDPAPSAQDIAVTKRLQDAGEILRIKVLDHIIIAGVKWFSFVDEDML